jgi:predicted phage-related endonuclease
MIEQGSPEWHARRAGKFTGSRFVDVVGRNKTTGKPLKAYHDLIWQLVVERMTGVQDEGVDSYSLRWGKELEGFAREEYELATGNSVDQIDFIDHPSFSFAGCSPDGLIGSDGGLEIKSPKSSSIHLERFLDGVPDEYIPQIQGALWITGRQWWDFASYDPRMPESHRLLVIRVERDEAYIQALEKMVIEAEGFVQARLDELSKRLI